MGAAELGHSSQTISGNDGKQSDGGLQLGGAPPALRRVSIASARHARNITAHHVGDEAPG
jgi:hypothetical protein